MQPKRQVLATAAALAAVSALVVWRVRASRDGDPTQDPELRAKSTVGLIDPEPHAAPCAFWAPWQRLVAPGDPKAYLEAVKRRLNEPSSRSGTYMNYINRENAVLAGDTESLCIRGRFDAAGAYQMDAGAPKNCEDVPQSFLDLNVRMDVEKVGDQGFINDIKVEVGLDQVTPEAVLAFFGEQAKLVQAGYGGWSGAFPAFHALNDKGFGPVAYAKTPDGGKLRYAWLTQPLRTWQPPWADFLMQLADLVTIQTTFSGAPGAASTLLGVRLETILNGLELTVPAAGVQYLAAPVKTPLSVAHDITVRFRGLEVKLHGMRFTGEMSPEPGALIYQGAFTGVDKVELGGAYRGFSGGSFGNMIKEVVAETIQEQLQRLTKGNNGKGWVFDIRHTTVGSKNVFTYMTSVQTPVNFLNLVRTDKDKADSPVLPNQQALQGLNRWSAASVDALVKDYDASHCAL